MTYKSTNNATMFLLATILFVASTIAHAQTGVSHGQQTAAKKGGSAATSGGTTPVVGSGTAGQITRWTGFSGNAPAIGDSSISEDKFGQIGIGTTSPTSALTVRGAIETTLGGYRFPDGTLQTTAGLSSVSCTVCMGREPGECFCKQVWNPECESPTLDAARVWCQHSLPTWSVRPGK